MKKKYSFKEVVNSDKNDRLPSCQWEELRTEILKRDEYVCMNEGCVREAKQVDHIMPVALGGLDAFENLQSLCEECHLLKTKQDIDKIAKIKRYRKKRARKGIGGFI